jgi:hypothetical protein
MRGSGIGTILEAFPILFGLTDMLSSALNAAAFGLLRPNPASAGLEARANEAAGVIRTTNNAKATFAAVLDITKLHAGSIEGPRREADLGFAIRRHH